MIAQIAYASVDKTSNLRVWSHWRTVFLIGAVDMSAGSRLRRDLTREGGVAPIAASATDASSLTGQLGGLEERFAFKRAISRLHEMQSAAYLSSRVRT